MSTNVYQPTAGSLADRVCRFFRINREEELTTKDIARKFDAQASSVPALMVSAMANHLVERRRGEQARCDEANAHRMQVLHLVRAAVAAAPRSAFDLHLAAQAAQAALAGVEYWGRDLLAGLWSLGTYEALQQQVQSGQMTADDLGRLLVDCALVSGLHVQHGDPKDHPALALMAAAGHYGIDAEPASTPSTAAQAGKGATAKPDKAKKPERDAKPGAPAKVSEEQTDDAGCAGEEPGRCDKTSDMFEAAA